MQAAGLWVVTRRTNQEILANNKDDAENKTDKKLKELDTQILIQYFFDEKNQLYLEIDMVLPWLKPL